MLPTKLYRRLNTINETAVSETVIVKVVAVNGTILNRLENTVIPITSPDTMKATRAVLIGLKGIQIRIMRITPVNEVTMVAIVEICSSVICQTSEAIHRNIMFKIIVTAPGIARDRMFKRKFPVTRSLFGSSASTNEGIPIAKAPNSDI